MMSSDWRSRPRGITEPPGDTLLGAFIDALHLLREVADCNGGCHAKHAREARRSLRLWEFIAAERLGHWQQRGGADDTA